MSQDQYWRSLESLETDPELLDKTQTKFEPELELTGLGRRSFLGITGATLALGGLTSLTGCRKPQEKIIPYARRPEDVVPGKPRYFATSALIGGSVMGLLVESQEGRPTKVEGNPQHPFSGGATNAWAQASVLDLYSPDRSQKPVKSGGSSADWNWKEALWREVDRFIAERFGELHGKNEGAGLALLLGETRSPTLRALYGQLGKKFPKARLYRHDAAHPGNALAGAAMVGVTGGRPMPALERAQVIVALDSDFLASEGDAVRNTRQFADGRRVTGPADKMNRLYAIEPAFTVTGAKADHRLQLRGSEIGAFLAAVAGQLFASGFPAPPAAAAVVAKLGRPAQMHGKWVAALAKDLGAHQGSSVVIVGERQPAWVHALANLVNAALGNVGRTTTFVPYAGPPAGTIGELAAAIGKKEVETLVMLGGNPAYDAPADLEFAKRIAEVPVSVHHSMFRDETSKLVTWHIAASHYLEAWGDLEATDGTTGIQQPLIAPLFGTLSEIELIARIIGAPTHSGHDLVRAHWASRGITGDFETTWRRWLHDGVMTEVATGTAVPAFSFAPLADALPAAPAKGGLELVFQLDPSVYDGRYAGNAWMQELPDPITKLTWDNAALMGPATAARLEVKSRDLVEITLGGRTLQIAVFVTPGVAADTVVLPLGYGRTAGAQVAMGRGFNTYTLRATSGLHFASGATVKKVKGSYTLASTQDYGSLTPTTRVEPGLVTQPQGFAPRPILRETTLEAYRKDPTFVLKAEVMPKEKIKSLFVEPHAWKQPPGKDPIPQQWGMSIDLNTCTGCNACAVACQSENNIGVVGKERVLQGRELSWIRMDRYYSGTPEDPKVSMQPMPCQQCENAPCETVCPVNATAHSPEGLNDMAYNRCIGTRYCANNCPYKVRRFNYFNFTNENDAAMPLLAMQRNPDVTVRFRGVMEKCTYCTQRISEAKIVAKRDGDGRVPGRVPDGAIVPACAQVCPAKAIVFGDISDPQSEISQRKKMDRDYAVLQELNTVPRTTYLAGLRNPNPELV
jgi:molybdopterin-containing oxidoreductase family iron-sulfur binding subunit